MSPRSQRDSGLLSREEFQRQVFARSQGRCVLCDELAVDAHHILERKLFPDGGFYLANGAAVCETCHWECETSRISVAEVRRACGIEAPRLPPGLEEGLDYDKWGNRIWASGMRSAGVLADDTGTRRALAVSGALGWLMPANYVDPDLDSSPI